MPKKTNSYNLQAINPALALEWHPSRNGALEPSDVTPGSSKKAWWLCKKGHEWHAVINNRTKGKGCPCCSGRTACPDNCFKTINPSLALEWHPTRNGDLKPTDVTPNSHKKVWWICNKGHKWPAVVSSRTSGSGCPYCAGQSTCPDNCLQTINPSLALEWHPTRNGDLKPTDVTLWSDKKVWWICNKGHEWPATIGHRTGGRGCPCCVGQATSKDNCLQTINPSLALEWHPTRNGDLKPTDVTPNSGKKVWWLCKKGHEWPATIDNRTKGRGCPCCHSATSVLELKIYSEIKYLFNNVLHRKKICGVECDVYIPHLKFGIEIDGVYWHKNKHFKDQQKTELLKKNGVLLLRLREKGLSKISENDIVFSNKDTGLTLTKKVIRVILEMVEVEQNLKKCLKVYLKRDSEANESEFLKLLELLPSPLPGDSLADKNKVLALEWHPTRNGDLKPTDVPPNSHKKVWWRCRKGHEWPAMISNRTKGRGCPCCGGKATCPDNCLKTINPSLALEWHPTRNGSLTPTDVTPGSNKKVWWICNKGHEWPAMINDRNDGTGCPHCLHRTKVKT